MKAVEFKHQNIVYGENQSEYESLHALKLNDDIISCWELSFTERIRILFFGKVWLSLMTFDKPLTPSFMSTDRKKMFSTPDDDIKWFKRIFKK